MLENKDRIYCGVFDSTLMRQNKSVSPQRTVALYEIELFTQAGGTSHVNGVSYPVRRGMLLIARPGDIRHSDFPVRCNFIRLSSDEKSDGELERIIRSLPTVTYLENEDTVSELLSLFVKLGSIYTSTTKNADIDILRVNSLFFEILSRAVKLTHVENNDTQSSGESAASRVVREAYEYINENFTSACTLSDIASAVHISPNYLHTIFCDQVGMTPHDYLTERRIENAKMLIRAGERSMLEIALECGFCSQSHFNKIFKQKCGLTPAKYKQNFVVEY